MVTTDLTEFIQDASLALLEGLAIAFEDGVHVGFPVL
jgi:hypothetical protein